MRQMLTMADRRGTSRPHQALSYNLLDVCTEPVRWLLLCYRAPGGTRYPLGILLYIPVFDELRIQMREDFSFVHDDDLEVVALSGATIINTAADMGAKKTWDWICETLSNTVFVEGPEQVVTDDPEAMMVDLFNQHCRPRN